MPEWLVFFHPPISVTPSGGWVRLAKLRLNDLRHSEATLQAFE